MQRSESAPTPLPTGDITEQWLKQIFSQSQRRRGAASSPRLRRSPLSNPKQKRRKFREQIKN